MITLYVREPGVVIRRAGQRLLVVKGTQTLQSARLRDLERLVLFGNAELSGSALAMLLEKGVETVLLSYGGKFRGRLSPIESKNVFLRRAQFRCYEDAAFRLRVARTIIDAKIRNARYVLMRYHWNHPAEALTQTAEALEARRAKLEPQGHSLELLMGIEGEAARLYFGAFGTMLRAEFAFTTRSRRPPRDPANALLSFGYTLLTTELTGAVAAQGLDPHVGFLHDLDYGRPSLALDLLEEFRQPVVDRLALSLINRGILQPKHFEDRGEAGVLLNDEGRPLFLECYHRAMEAEFEERASGERMSYRALLLRQAGRMQAMIAGNGEYAPFSVR